MSGTATAGRLLTAEEFARLPFEGAADLVEGVIVAIGPAGGLHGNVVVTCAAILRAAVAAQGAPYVVVAGDVGFVLARDPDHVRGADVALMHRDRLAGGRPPVGFIDGAPDLAVEVRSPWDRPGAIDAKLRGYLAAGARVVWDIDPAAARVTVHRPGSPSRILAAGDALDPAPVLAPIPDQVSALFGS